MAIRSPTLTDGDAVREQALTYAVRAVSEFLDEISYTEFLDKVEV